MPNPNPDAPAPGQRSVWKFPRPAIAEPTTARLRVIFGGQVVAETTAGVMTLETSHPPTYYFPPDDVDFALIAAASGSSLCEWKGAARYFDVVAGSQRAAKAAWAYPDPTPTFAILRNHLAFYPAAMDGCFVDGERVVAQEGGFYGGWITSHYAGPFKGVPGSRFW